MGPFEMVVAIVGISAVASVMRAKHGVGRRRRRDRKGWEEYPLNEGADSAESEKLRGEIKTLKERIAVLERIATENNRAIELDREIERLRQD